MRPKLNLIAAACANGGIGFKGDLPWRIRSEMAYFTRMTQTTEDKNKQNAVVMGRKSWDCIPLKFRPLSKRLNIVLTNQKNLDLKDEAKVCNSFDEIIDLLNSPPYNETIENVWVIGGSSIYELAMKSEYCHRVYLTDVMAEFECDTFFPMFDKSTFKLIYDPEVPEGIQTDNGINYEIKVYEKIK